MKGLIRKVKDRVPVDTCNEGIMQGLLRKIKKQHQLASAMKEV